MNILIIANARRAGGLSGGDNIYLNFSKYWSKSARADIWDMLNIDFKPFCVCYVYRILVGCWYALFTKNRWDVVYSASDFLMDSLPAWILKMKGCKWWAGFYLFAPKGNIPYVISQMIARPIINKYADKIMITNETMDDGKWAKEPIPVYGGVDIGRAKCPPRDVVVLQYDAVFIGRIHPTKGIDDLIDIWKKVLMRNPYAKLAVIGDGDLGVDYLKKRLPESMGVTYCGFMGDERYEVYKGSRYVLYPAITHFSMSPVEAMACGCTMITYNSDMMRRIKPLGALSVRDNEVFADIIAKGEEDRSKDAVGWARKWDWKVRCEAIWKRLHG